MIRMMVGRHLNDLFPKIEVPRGEVMLRVEGLSRTGLFRDIGFELHRGEILGLAGLVGARRTEVAQSIFGIDPPESGKVWVEGKEARIRNPADAMKLGIAYVPEDRQQHGLVLPMNITHNVTLPILEEYTRLGWLNQQREANVASEMSNKLEVRAAGLWQKARELSGGNQQKVVLAKWLSVRPRILILDEPTRGIDVGAKAEVHALMSRLAETGIGILMISSELPEVLGMSDRIIVMCEGRLTGEFERSEATQEKVMTAAVARDKITPETAPAPVPVGSQVGDA